MSQSSREQPTEVVPTGSHLVGSDRVLAVLIELAGHADGIGLDELARTIGSAKSTVHRALASLKRAGLAVQDGRGSYLLGDEFLRLAFTHHELRPDHVRVRPVLEELVRRFGETVHYAVLSERSVVYRSKVDPSVGAVQLTSVVGGRNPAYCTAVGKLLLSYSLPDDRAVREWVGSGTLPRHTEHTLTSADELCEELGRIRQLGYSVDNQENETGVNCVALPVFFASPTVPSGAISVSGLSYRTPLATLVDKIDEITEVIGPLSSGPAARRES
ncbi:IclR family transcriptional regulator [Parafrigoribacterium humi]|uniref:IclR family transcriptional regulator n=1 Tax=Parafrigoribacterium humi TaxID=3144664 RepID=UPI0032EC58FC